MPFDSPTTADLPALYAQKCGHTSYSLGTMLFSKADRSSMSHVATVFRVMGEGEVWKRYPQDAGFRVTWGEAQVAARVQDREVA